MEHPETVLVWLGIILVMVGPAAILVLLRRLLRRWWAALLVTVIVAPFAAFMAVGGAARLLAYERVVVHGDTSGLDPGESVAEHLGHTAVVCGAYGLMFAGSGFALSVPVLIAWRLIHRRSFDRLAFDRGEVG